jgi:two-component system, chemotaxis family, sensor kinase CheA
MSRLLKFIVLPRQISDFENNYLRRMNRIGFAFFALHVPVFAAVAYFNDTGPLLALALTAAVLVGPAIAYFALSNPRMVSVVYGFTAMLMGGLLVHFGQGPVQIEMHFYFFALLAMLAVYGNPVVILTAAVTVALHHLIVWLSIPTSVFNYDAPVWVVAIHAAFVVLESVATCFIARSFFDNVIGLEKIVQARTRELDGRNRDMRLVLDNVGQGFLTIDRNMVMSAERSRIIADWLGEAADGEIFPDYVGRRASRFASMFRMAWTEVIDGIMPIEVTIDQLPHAFTVGGRHLRVDYTPIGGADGLEKTLIMISDVTADVERGRLEAEQRDIMNVLERIGVDKPGVLEFFDEATDQIGIIADPKIVDVRLLKRVIHTLKGNSMIFGINTVAELCHTMESRIDDEGTIPSNEEREELHKRMAHVRATLATLLGDKAHRRVEIDDAEYERILTAVLQGEPREKVARMIANWKLEPTARRLGRIAEQAQGIAKRLNKSDLKIAVQHDDLRLDPAQWSSFWSAFVHIVRNAVDHGIESPEDRQTSGKPPAGTLTLTTRIDRDELVIELADDGRGIDWPKVAEKARVRAVPHSTQEELVEALFTDGISTRDDVNEFSGRGVGLGVARTACNERGGSMRILPRPDAGTRVEFRFPGSAMAATLRPAA